MPQRKEPVALKNLLSETDQILATKRVKMLDGVTPGALFSECGRFRYWLLRTWDADLPTVAFIGLNPSVADIEFDDRTVHKCQMFAREWRYGTLLMLNIYAFIATYPKDMRKAADRLDIIGGKRNSLGMLRHYLEDFKVKRTVAAWGRGAPTLGAEAARVIPEMFCLAKNKDNSPKHPLYIAYSETLKPFNFPPAETYV
ncbi:MAG: DUF1643 domain-containing protein [Candidatus Sulfotelmatobacter sp.]